MSLSFINNRFDLSCRLIRLHPPSDADGRLGCFDFVVARPHTVFLIACKCLLCILLANQLPLVVLFVPEHVVVGWDRRRVWHHHLLCALPIPLVRGSSSLGIPLCSFVVLPRTGNVDVLLVDEPLVEALHFRREGIVGLNKLDPELIKAELLQRLRALHRSVDIVETVSRIICPRTCN